LPGGRGAWKMASARLPGRIWPMKLDQGVAFLDLVAAGQGVERRWYSEPTLMATPRRWASHGRTWRGKADLGGR
jgi:hypothetical protein